MGLKFNPGATGMNSSQSPGHEPSISTEASVQSKSKYLILVISDSSIQPIRVISKVT